MTGSELRARRVDAGVLAHELAREMQVHSSRVSQIEALATVTPRTAERYTSALARCSVNNTAEEAIA
jgi:transcriptional regulator with XRE-family HTH domain